MVRINKTRRIQLISLFVPFLIIGFAYFFMPGFQVAVNEVFILLMKGDIEKFRDYLLSFGVWSPIISFLAMILTLIVAPLPAFVVTFTNGLLFGAFWGGMLSWMSSMTGAVICFYIAKSLGKPIVEKLVSKTALEWTNKFIKRYGIHSILIARMIPIVSFAIVIYAAGLTSIRLMPFLIATGIGQLPATILYSVLGESASETVLVIFWAFIVVICFGIIGAASKPWIEKKLKKDN